MDTTITICILNTNDINTFKSVFGNNPSFSIEYKNITQATADCIVTNANSYGRMDGGVDGAINMLMTSYEPMQRYFHERVQHIIAERYCGEQPVGTTLLVKTHHPRIKWVAHMPTMKVPEDVSTSINAYLAFRSMLVEIIWHNKHADEQSKIKSIVCTPCCTSAGQMTFIKSAKQMKAAWESIFNEPVITDWNKLHAKHAHLKNL